jgi:carotenoid cleavage dioxygenase-like enzyme
MADVEVYGKMLSTLPDDDDHPYRSGAWRPQNVEYDADDLRVEGELPADLYGVYLRNTENPLHPAIVRYHPFDGDGMIHKVSFRDGKVSYRNRFVRTDGLLAEQEAGRSLWAGLAENPSAALRQDGWGARGRMKDAASTDVIVHAGVAVASFYQCGDLYRLDPLTLDDLGKCSWGGSFPGDLGVSAHTKVDDHTGELLFFNYSTTAPYLHYGVVDAGNHLVHYVPVDLPGPRLPHDMAFTEHYAILNDMPLFWEPDLIARGRYAARYHPELPSRLGVIPRRGGTGDIRWFEFDPTYVLHWVNAWEEGDEVVVDGFFQGCPEPAAAGPGGPDGRMWRFLAQDAMQTRLHRWRMNLVTGATSEQDLSEACTEFGTINSGFGGRPYRYTYAATNEPGWFLFNGLVKHDTVTGREESYQFEPGVFCSEVGVAPRVGGTGEDDAYLVTLTVDMNRDLSECVVFRASDVGRGPIARAQLPERIASGTHSCWAPGDSLRGWA